MLTIERGGIMVVFGENLKRIRLLKGLSLREAAKLLGMSHVAVSKYEKGLIVPNSQMIIEFANAYHVKVIELLQTYEVPRMKFTSFRKKSRLKGQKLKLLESVIQNYVAKYLEVLSYSVEDSDFALQTYKCSSLDDAEEAAYKFRESISFSFRQPISDLISILENLGILIITVDNKEHQFDDFDGLSEVVNGIPIIVILDDICDGARQRFTLAHELGHLVLDIKDKTYDEEKLCHRFASAFLMPKEAVVHEFGDFRDNISFFELEAFKQEYRVSYAAIVYRLKDLNIINEYLYKKLNIEIRKKIGNTDPHPIDPEVSYQFKKLVHQLEARKIISIQKASEYLDEYNIKDTYYGY